MLKTIVTAAVLAGGLAAPATARQPQPDTFQRDVRCLAAALVMAGDADPAIADAGVKSAFYFGGRIEGRNAKADTMGLASAEMARMTAEETQAVSKACGQVLMERGKAWENRSAELDRARGR